jgi:ribonuclease P protein component
MIPRPHRVTRELFSETMQASKVFHSQYLSIRIGVLSKEVSSVSFVVSKKVDTRATKRNTLRRKGYAALERLIERLKPSVVLIFAKKEAQNLSVDALQKEIENVLSNAGVIR